MKIKITKPGIYGAEGEIPVGTTMSVKDAPKGWAGRYEEVSLTETFTAPAVIDDARAELLAAAAMEIAADAFNAEGVPDVRALNAELTEDAPKFTAAERDALWPGVAAEVTLARG
ncbi:hypothetical protein [Sagittula sp. S175]|uniref:hypothetical protein n=1 Tax=Sagittula sp. S175 TaxID=3415129 RepID=UPI003C7DDAE7